MGKTIVTNHVSIRGLMSKLHKEFLRISYNNEIKDPMKKSSTHFDWIS